MVESKELELIKSNNFTPIQQDIIELLKDNVAMTRNDICREFEFGKHAVLYFAHPNRVQRRKVVHKILFQYNKRTTIYDNLIKLQKRKIVEKFSYNNGERGRPLVYWQLRGDVQ